VKHERRVGIDHENSTGSPGRFVKGDDPVDVLGPQADWKGVDAGLIDGGNEDSIEFVGMEVVCPYRPITMECRGAMNFICPSNERQDRAMVAATNKTGTSILAFEYTQLKEPFDFAHHEDETASISGNIDAIVPNPNKSRFLVMRLFISNGVIHLNDKPPKQISTRANKSLDASGISGLVIRKTECLCS